MDTEKYTKIYIFIVTFASGILFSAGIMQFGEREWYDSLITFAVVILNIFLVKRRFKTLTKKD